ncbi:hypothetical protein DSO57_1023636 [Entomophthora muscae]|uniref:Uncharacterized protein n=1 Tax=Entomophthora muscae TaxID=34485 RepID=A0ACC2RHK3_9FUNG|nr:hypothetical protein DSO57_1023636 [Entomophthora muscae]
MDIHDQAPDSTNFNATGPHLDLYNRLPTCIRPQLDMSICNNIQKVFLDVRIVNLLPLKTWAQGRDSNPEPKFLQAAGPMDREPAHLRFSKIKPPQAEAPAKS